MEGLLAGAEPPSDQPALRPLADMLAALTAAPAEEELAGLPAALAAFRQLESSPPAALGAARCRPARRWPRVAPLLTAKAAAAAAAAAISLGGLASAAYAGALPAPLQRVAHVVIGAPASGRSPAPHSPAASASAGRTDRARASQLCSAYFHPAAGQTDRQRASTLRQLIAAAGGAGKITAYCAAAGLPAPSESGQPPTAGPSARPGRQAHPSPGRRHGGGRPSSLPSPHPTPSHPSPSLFQHSSSGGRQAAPA